MSNVGLVHDYQRWGIHWDDILTLFKTTIGDDDLIRGWTITCEGHNDSNYQWERTGSSGTAYFIADRTYQWKIRGFFTHNDEDETEKTTFPLAQLVVKALNLDEALHDADLYLDPTPPAELSVFELRLFGGVLCHYAEITQQIAETVAEKSS